MKNNRLFCAAMLMMASMGAQAADGKQHAFGVFLGATDAKNETEFTYGIEYEYKFTPRWGAGLVYERTDEAHHGDGVDVTLGSIYYHPDALRLGLGFGREKVKGAHPHSENLIRLSASYDFHVGEFAVAPTFAVDFIDDDEAVVIGVAILKPF